VDDDQRPYAAPSGVSASPGLFRAEPRPSLGSNLEGDGFSSPRRCVGSSFAPRLSRDTAHDLDFGAGGAAGPAHRLFDGAGLEAPHGLLIPRRHRWRPEDNKRKLGGSSAEPATVRAPRGKSGGFPDIPDGRLPDLAWMDPIWTTGAMLWTARIVVGEVRVRQIVRRARLLRTSQAKSCFENIRQVLQIKRTVEVRTSGETAIPFTRGAFRPTILLPVEAHQWSQKQLESVLAHELAHVRRYDCLTHVPAQVACALFWFHPLVWLAAFEIRQERERACDDIVLSSGHRATDYAEFLLELRRSLRRLDSVWLTIVAPAQSSRLEVRMKALLDPKLNHRPLTARCVALAAVLTVALLLPAAAIRATAQNTLGKVSCTVHDPSGAVIPGANIALIDMETQHSVGGHTGEDGAFEFPAVPAGRYRLEITKPGFAPLKSADLELKPSRDLHQDITLPMGEVRQQVMVLGRKSGEISPTPPSAPRRIRVGGLVESAHLIRETHPDYPASCKKQGIEGTVTLQAVIGTNGHILALSPISGPDPALIKSAMDAVNQWQYRPTLLNGLPVEVATTIEVTFKLDD
jgi:TonB family protein